MPPTLLGVGINVTRLGIGGNSPTFPWTPQYVISDLEMWHDADDATTFTINSGVEQWRDKTANLRHVGQATAGNRPVVTPAGLNGKPVVSFTPASSHHLRWEGAAILAGAITVYAVFQLNGGSSRALLSLPFTGGSFFDAIFNVGAGYRALSFMRTNGASSGIGTSGGNFSTAATILSLRYNGGTVTDPASYSADTDGNAQTVLSSGTFSRFGTVIGTIGARFNNNTLEFPWNGFLAELVVYRGTPTTDIEDRIEGYLAHKWGLTAGLPAGHPYKTVAPTSNF